MKVSVLKPLFHAELGALRRGAVVDMPEPWATRYLKRGAVEKFIVAEKRAAPLAEAGEEELSSASPAVPASAQKTLRLSRRGGKRPKKAEQ